MNELRHDSILTKSHPQGCCRRSSTSEPVGHEAHRTNCDSMEILLAEVMDLGRQFEKNNTETKISLFIHEISVELRPSDMYTLVCEPSQPTFLRILSCAHNWITHIQARSISLLPLHESKEVADPREGKRRPERWMNDVKIEALRSKQTIRCNNIYSMILERPGCRLEADADPSSGFGPARLSPPPSSLVSLSSTF